MQPAVAAAATASADIAADLEPLTIDEPRGGSGKTERLMATGKPLNAKSIKVALAANKPKVRNHIRNRNHDLNLTSKQAASPLRTCETPGGSVHRSMDGMMEGSVSPAVAIST